MIRKDFLALLNLIKTQIFYIWKSIKIVIIYKNINLIFVLF